MALTAERIKDLLGLEPLMREGGHYKKTYRSDEALPDGAAAGRAGAHVLGGAIVYLLENGTYSRMHKLTTDEVYHFYLGDAVLLTVLKPDGTGETIRLGHDIEHGERVQAVVPRGCWQGSRVADGGAFALIGTTLAPDYEASDYTDGEKDALCKAYPAFGAEIDILAGEPRY